MSKGKYKAKAVTKTLVTGADSYSKNFDFSIIGDTVTPEESLKKQFECINSAVTLVTSVTASNDAACSGNQTVTSAVTLVTPLINKDFDNSEVLSGNQASIDDLLGNAIDPDQEPPEATPEAPELERPCYAVYDDFNAFGKAGVYYHGLKTDKEGNVTKTNDYICDPLHVDAGSCDGSDNNFGLMLRFKNQRYHWRKWLMPLDMLAGSCEELRGELLRQGLRIDHHKRAMLPSYLQSQRPKKQLECALKVGWHDDCFVLPDRVIGNRDDVFFQTDHAVVAEYGQRGKLSDWQHNVGRYCVGNPLLILQTSIGFAGALLKKCHVDYAGFHIFGDSSKGKSTGHKIAGSIWGGESFRRSWKATGNGLEAAAMLYNDGLLALDELGDSDAREVNQVIYALGNGTGKQRANVKGGARAVHKWRIVLLSNGEKTLESHFQEKGLAVKAGQSVRLLQIPVFGQHGAFDELHGMKDGRLFSDTLQKNSGDYYGTAGIAYLERLVNDGQDFGGLLEEAIKAFITDDMQPQEMRAARSFALVALAGELASDYGVTGWVKGATIDAVKTCFQQWRDHRGVGATEDKVILDAVKDFIDRFGDSRFTNKITDEVVHGERAGWYSDSMSEERAYLFTNAGLKDATKGYDIKRVVESLTKATWLARGSKGEPTKQHKISGRNFKLHEITLKEVNL
ncbi:MAG: DUF927 domain-containing protein [Methylococcaceae bacterium]